MSELNNSDQDIDSLQKKRQRQTWMVVAAVLVAIIILLLISLVGGKASQQTAEFESTKVNNNSEPAVTLSVEETESLREQFKNSLSVFETQYQPLLDDVELSSWQSEQVNEALKTKELAISQFATGSYKSAVVSLELAMSLTKSAKSQWDSDFEAFYSEALSHFNNDELAASQLALNKAKNVKPSSSQLTELQQQLDDYPYIQKQYQEYNVAITENNLQKQITILQRILSRDSEHEPAKSDLARIKVRVIEQRFQAYINEGLSLLAKGDLQGADAAYVKASKVFPNRAELNVLAKKLDKQDADLTLQSVTQQLTELSEQDNWAEIQTLVAQAEPYFPSDALVAKYKEQASAILSLRRDAQVYLQKPERLADDNIQGNAKALIRKAIPYMSISQSLADEIKLIGENIDKASQAYPLTIISDGRTHIEVLRTGVLGTTKNTTIQLTAGTYVLEGSRKGYRNKQVTVTIDKNTNNTVNLVCNERI
ncbi:hypothetical protein BB427_03205 [Pseudoalteromonas sp. BMB]|uniref:hypothetical protein n=1 Tax=Pseudoalteromonas sp. BMB TaxID=1874619 RepID=UPI00083D37E5|nr:hypothetical protein [Pseudoalteromonas sp. BMB]ODB35623.1 hypothetical protein BB427_03205 [Pseudoalteromonas sp. BMB]